MILAAAGLTNAEDVDEFSIMLPIIILGWRAKYSPPPVWFEYLAGVAYPCIRALPKSLKGILQFDDRRLFTFGKIEWRAVEVGLYPYLL